MNAPDRTAPLVLVVEDEHHLRAVLRFQLEAAGVEVLEATDGQRAIAQALTARPDLVLSDTMLPVCDGFEMLKRLRSEPVTARIPVIFLSAAATADDRVAALQAGANDFISKPWQHRELILRIRNAIEWPRPAGAAGLSVHREPRAFFSCFISYSTADARFATILHRRLLAAGVDCWKWDEDAKTGLGLWAEIDSANRRATDRPTCFSQ